MKRLCIFLVIMALVILTESCSRPEIPIEKKEKIYLSAWNVYWDLKNVNEEIKWLQSSVDEICYFASYFNSKNDLFIPDGTTQIFREIKDNIGHKEYIHYITIVNDKINVNGSSSLKDTDLLYELFSDEERMANHIEEIQELVSKNGYEGVEIDYEGIRKDIHLWNLFINFCDRLYSRLEENNIKLRVVLESSAPLQNISLPAGPDYVMMCYNLYGSHSGPGPKADKEFILDLVQKMESLEGEKYFAFATGGFDWDDKGKVTALTEQMAWEIIEKYQVTPVRDKKSGSLTFTYIDQDKMEHEVWFADSATLIFWMDTVKSRGYNRFSLWRLNGNRDESLYKIGEYIKNY